MPCYQKYNHLRNYVLTPKQDEIVFGSILGDMCIRQGKRNINPSMIICHSTKQKEYFDWKYNELSPCFKSIQYRQKEDGTSTFTSESIVLPNLHRYKNMFYTKDRIKVVPKNFELLLTPLALAVWICDDGSLCIEDSHGYTIATMSFTEEEHDIMIKVFNDKFNLYPRNGRYFSVKNNTYYNRICFNMSDSRKLSKIIESNVPNCMKYKIFQ